MPKKPIETKEDADRQEYIQDLQRRAKEFVSGELSVFESEEVSQGLREQFWEHVVAFEKTEWITSFDLLVQGGMELPAPEELDDSQLTDKLWEVIRGLARPYDGYYTCVRRKPAGVPPDVEGSVTNSAMGMGGDG